MDHWGSLNTPATELKLFDIKLFGSHRVGVAWVWVGRRVPGAIHRQIHSFPHFLADFRDIFHTYLGIVNCSCVGFEAAMTPADFSRKLVDHACNPSLWNAEAGGWPQIWSQHGLYKRVQGQPALYSKTLSQKNELWRTHLRSKPSFFFITLNS